MKTFSRNCLLLLAIGFFLCCSDHLLAIMLPYAPKFAGKMVSGMYKTLSEIGKFVQRI